MLSKWMIIFSLFFLCSFEAHGQASSDRGLEIYFVRHAETEGNRTHKHTHENDRTFSARGQEQVATLTGKLSRLRFDYILVSPKYRAMNTVFPYLQKTGTSAIIWPELAECCWQKKRSVSPSAYLRQGSRIKIESAMKPYFSFRDENSSHKYKTHDYADGMAQVIKGVDLIRKQFSQSGKKILLVGHYHAGARIIEMLQGLAPEGHFQPSNAQITHLREMPDGTFKLISSNQ